MSKRYYPQQTGDRKKAKLDISISDHNFPLSQNNDVKDVDFNSWGDDNEDEILLLASQACEQAYNSNNLSILPDYSICMQPGSTSTQMSPVPSTSKTEFTFKKPSVTPSQITTMNLKEKCSRISSPLPYITAKVAPKTNGEINLTNDLIFYDRVYKGQDSDQIYRQLLQIQEENEKLKSENGKLLEKCVTKQGEASILRTQLKSCQMAVDNARLEKIKAQEKVQMEWTEKLGAVNTQMHDLRTQLDFKNLEIISIKEKCKKLESTKLKLTQVTIGNNDISQRANNSFHNDISHRRVKTSSNAVQTESKAHFVHIHKTCVKENTSISPLLTSILEPSITEQYSLLDNEKLSRTDSAPKCRIYSTIHRIPTSPHVGELKGGERAAQLSSVHEELTDIASGGADKDVYFRVFKATKSMLKEVENKLTSISNRLTSAFQKEMDEKYIESTGSYLDVGPDDLLKGRSLYKEEQDIQTRRSVTILGRILQNSLALDMFNCFEKCSPSGEDSFLDYVHRICGLLDSTTCATLYSGLLFSITILLEILIHSDTTKTLDILKIIIISRPMPFVVIQLLKLVGKVSVLGNFAAIFCPGNNLGNLKLDYDQGVILYNKDCCGLQVLLNQVESSLKCIEKQSLGTAAVQTTRQLILLYSNINCNVNTYVQDKSKAGDELVTFYVAGGSSPAAPATVLIIKFTESFPLHAKITEPIAMKLDISSNEALSICRCGIKILYQCTLRDVEFSSQLGFHEGHLIQFCELVRRTQHSEVYGNMLSELTSSLQSTPEETPSTFDKKPLLKSFENFCITD